MMGDNHNKVGAMVGRKGRRGMIGNVNDCSELTMVEWEEMVVDNHNKVGAMEEWKGRRGMKGDVSDDAELTMAGEMR